MPVSRLGVPQPAGSLDSLPERRGPSGPELRALEAPAGPGQAFADLLLLAALACQTPVSLVSVLQAGRTWSTLSHGFETRDGLNDGRLFEAIATSSQPVELADLMGRVPRSPLVQPPHSMRWAYGVSIRDSAGSVMAVVAVMDRWLRQLTKREQKALAAAGPSTRSGSCPRCAGRRATTVRCCTGWTRPGPVPALTRRGRRGWFRTRRNFCAATKWQPSSTSPSGP